MWWGSTRGRGNGCRTHEKFRAKGLGDILDHGTGGRIANSWKVGDSNNRNKTWVQLVFSCLCKVLAGSPSGMCPAGYWDWKVESEREVMAAQLRLKAVSREVVAAVLHCHHSQPFLVKPTWLPTWVDSWWSPSFPPFTFPPTACSELNFVLPKLICWNLTPYRLKIWLYLERGSLWK